MNRIRLLGTCLALGGVVLLSGCVAYPAGSYGYSEPYYVDPGPAVVQPNVYIDGTYYSRPRYPYYGRPGYYGPGYGPRHDHDGPRPGHGPRPSAGAPSPRAATAPLVREIQRSAPAARQPRRQDDPINLP